MKKFIMILGLLTYGLTFSALGLNLPFTTDGNLNFDKIANKTWSFPDSHNSFKIQKENDDYYILYYGYDEEQEKETFEKHKLTVDKNVYFKDGVHSYVYAYDTKLKTAVILDSDDLRIIFPADLID